MNSKLRILLAGPAHNHNPEISPSASPSYCRAFQDTFSATYATWSIPFHLVINKGEGPCWWRASWI